MTQVRRWGRGVSAPRYAVALPLPRYAGSGIRAQFVERRLFPGNQCGWQASIGERFQKILTFLSSPSAERRSAVRGFRSRSDSGSFAALRSDSGGPQRERAALFHSLVLSLDDPLSDLMTRGGGSQSADANVNNGLSSARREPALKVQIHFSSTIQSLGFPDMSENLSKSARVRAICAHARTQRISAPANIARIWRILSRQRFT